MLGFDDQVIQTLAEASRFGNHLQLGVEVTNCSRDRKGVTPGVVEVLKPTQRPQRLTPSQQLPPAHFCGPQKSRPEVENGVYPLASRHRQ